MAILSDLIKSLAVSAAMVLIACGDDGGSGLGQLGGTKDSGLGGTEASAPEASTGSNDAHADAYTYPIDPNGPPPDCILPCVWEVMKRCPGPEPGQLCVSDTFSRPWEVQCCPMNPPAPEQPLLCDDDDWVAGTSSVYKDSKPCWWQHGESSAQAPGPPPRPADWTTTWYVPNEATGGETRIASVQHRPDPWLPGPVIGQGACYEGDRVVFTSYVDVTAEHCQQWFPQCDVPGTCPLPPAWVRDADAGLTDAARGGTDAAPTPVDAASTLDATSDAPQGG